MKENSFWSDACKYGAILGLVASVSTIFVTYLLNYSSVSLILSTIIGFNLRTKSLK